MNCSWTQFHTQGWISRYNLKITWWLPVILESILSGNSESCRPTHLRFSSWFWLCQFMSHHNHSNLTLKIKYNLKNIKTNNTICLNWSVYSYVKKTGTWNKIAITFLHFSTSATLLLYIEKANWEQKYKFRKEVVWTVSLFCNEYSPFNFQMSSFHVSMEICLLKKAPLRLHSTW